MKKHKLLLVGLVASVSFWLLMLFLDIDFFEYLTEMLQKLEKYELDELIISIFIFLLFAYFDQTRKQKTARIDREKAKIYRAMLLSTHHILNNFLNQMMLFKLAAEETHGFPQEVLTLYDQIIQSAQIQIKALGNVENINEESILSSVDISHDMTA